MALFDLISCLVVAALSSVFVYFQMYFLAVFSIMFFLLVVVNICLMHVHMPKPVFLLEIKVENEKEEESV